MPGATASLYFPLLNSSIEECRMGVELTRFKLFLRHNMTSYSRLQLKFWCSFLTQYCYAYVLHALNLLVDVQCVTVMNI